MGILNHLKKRESNQFIKKATKIAEKVEALSNKMKNLTDTELQNKTEEFKTRLKNGETLEDILVEAFAVGVEASERVLNMRHYQVQIIGGYVLHKENVAEMRTGEGKTLVATLPAYLNALTGKGVHVVTVNDYLAQRDHDITAPLFHFLGLSTGVVLDNMDNAERKDSYGADITYVTNTQMGFDYLRDNMVFRKEDKVQRELHYCIVDEVDSVLLDDARTPLIISGQGEEPSYWYRLTDMFVRTLTKEEDFKMDEESRSVWLEDSGIEKAEKFFKIANYAGEEGLFVRYHVEKALSAHHFFIRDKEYILSNNQVLIIDESTGRISDGRRYSNGVHQAIEAKEGVEIQSENKTLATITYQNLFLLYEKLSGMTGTALTEEGEFREIYGLPVVVIPTHRPIQRIDLVDKLYIKEEKKNLAIAYDVMECYKKGQPVLIGTGSVEKSETISRVLEKYNIPHVVLNAKNHKKEAEIIENAGQLNAVTIATNMAGRGTDIKLGEGVDKLGGLKIIGTERNSNRRIDNQLAGRSGRQGDPGCTQFYLSFDDDLLRIFSNQWVKNLVQSQIEAEEKEAVILTQESGELQEPPHVELPMLTKSITQAQKRIEGSHYDMRKQTIQYDNVVNQQRMVLYKQRNQVLNAEMDVWDLLETITIRTFEDSMKVFFDNYLEIKDDESFFEGIQKTYVFLESNGIFLSKQEKQRIEETIGDKLPLIMKEVIEVIQPKIEERKNELKKIEESKVAITETLLQTIDTAWTFHLERLDEIKEEVKFAGYKQANPVQEYTMNASVAFDECIAQIERAIVPVFFTLYTNFGTKEFETVETL